MNKIRYDNSTNLPIIFSVTGHIDISDSVFVKEKIEDLFNSFKKSYHNTNFLLLTSLVEGADRIAAHAAKKCGVKIAPVLPMAAEEYSKSFKGQGYNSINESLADFWSILQDEEHTYTPCILNENNDEGEGYRNLSAYLIANSHVMISAWDGRVYNGAGGTYDTTRMAFNGIDSDLQDKTSPMSRVRDKPLETPINYLNVEEDCLIYWIPSTRLISKEEYERRGGRNKEVQLGKETGYIVPKELLVDVNEFGSHEKGTLIHSIRNLIKSNSDNLQQNADKPSFVNNAVIESGDRNGDDAIADHWFKSIPEYYDDIFKKMDELNVELSTVDYTDVEYNTRFELMKYESDQIEKIKEHLCMDDLAIRYNAINAITMRYQKNSFDTIALAAIIGVFAGLFFNLFILLGGSTLIILAYLLLNSSNKHIHMKHMNAREYQKFIEYRSLSESLRVNYYWGLLGINSSTSSVCYGYMKNETMWIRGALKAWGSFFLNNYSASNEIEPTERISAVKDCWLGDQISYHEGKKIRNERLLNRNRSEALYLGYAVFIASLVSIIGNVFFLSQMNSPISIIGGMSILGIALLPTITISYFIIVKSIMICLAALLGYVIIKKDSIHGGTPHQIEAKKKMFLIASKRLFQISNLNEDVDTKVKQSIKVFYELGVQSIGETNDWAFEHKTKNLKPQKQNIDPAGD